MDRRSVMLMAGMGVLAAVVPAPQARAHRREAQPLDAGISGAVAFGDEFDGPAGSAPDYTKWTVAQAREQIRNPVFWDRPENMGQYRDDRRNVFLDGNSHLVLRATREGASYFSGKIQCNWQGGIGHMWEARVKLNCLTAGCWPAWWLWNGDPAHGGEVDLLEWFGNGMWGPGTTVHANLYGTAARNSPIDVDSGWHTWRCQWDQAGIRFWQDPASGAPPYFDVAAGSITGWPFNEPGYQMLPVLNLAVSGSGGGDPSRGNYPADMLIDWVRVW